MKLSLIARYFLGIVWLIALSPLAFGKGELTFVSQGGAYQAAQTKAILNPSAKVLKITLNQDSSPNEFDVVKTQVQNHAVTWDVVDVPAADCLRAAREGLLTKLDYREIPNAKAIQGEFKSKYCIGYITYATVLAYRTDKYGKHPPHSWADFWNVKKFPGPRALRNNPQQVMEAALMADGVPPSKLYPLDVNRAFKKLDQIKPYITTWWTSGGQSAQLLANGDVDMIMAWNGRVNSVMKSGAPASFTFHHGILEYETLCVPKGTRHPHLAMKFINQAISARHQANLPKYIDYGPINPEAYRYLSSKQKKSLPSAPQNAKQEAVFSAKWWASPEGTKVLKEWTSFLQQ